MAENDIYNNQEKYKQFQLQIESYLQDPKGYRKYKISNPINLKHFKRFFLKLDARDNAYVRRLRLCRIFLFICHYIKKDLRSVTRDDIDELMLQAYQHNKSTKSIQCLIIDLKFVWKLMFPETDDQGRADETVVPHPVRHLSARIDKSREKLRQDRLDAGEYRRLLATFADDVRMQALISLAFESLGRPQEILGRKLRDVQICDHYAKVTISEHGKEGIGILRSIDSYPYLTAWINAHPLKDNPDAHLFINLGTRRKYGQMKPAAANKLIRERCKRLGIAKPITLYSLKRNGVTHCRLRGDSDVDIQHRARWSSTRQLQTYDLSQQNDSFKKELVERGLWQAGEKEQAHITTTRTCVFCHTANGVTHTICSTCKRPLDRKKIEAETTNGAIWKDKMDRMQETIQELLTTEQKRSQYDDLLNRLLSTPKIRPLILEQIQKDKIKA